MLKEISPDSGKAYAILTYNGRLNNVKLRASSSLSDDINVHSHGDNLQFCEIDVS